VRLNLDLEAQLFDLSFTYGVLDSLDVNIDRPGDPHVPALGGPRRSFPTRAASG
jgi:hypothetical protein